MNPIILTTEERDAAVAVVDRVTDCNIPNTLVERIVEAVNAVRLGAPAGTIKRSPEGYIAERREDTETGERHWSSLTGWRHQGRELSQADVDAWETIYEPGVKRVVVEPLPPGTYRCQLYPPAYLEYFNGDTIPVFNLKREPRVIEGRGLGDAERDAEWTDKDGDRWRATPEGWEISTPADGFRSASPDRLYAPYTEVVG